MNKYLIALLVTLFIFINGCKDKVTGPSSIGGNVICYEKSYNNYWEIYTNNITGSNPQNISNYSNDDEYPQWSPDGRYIVYSRSTSIYGPLVIVYDTKNRTEINLTSDGGLANLMPQWAPNGKVYFSYQRPIGSTTATYLINPDGSDKKKIFITPTFFYEDSYTFLYVIDYTKIYKTDIDSTINKFVCDLVQAISQNVAIQGFNPHTEELLVSFISSNKDSSNKVATYNIITNHVDSLLTAEEGYTFFQLKYSNDYSKIALIEHSDKDEYLSILENGVKKRIVRIPKSSPNIYFSFNPMQFSPDGKYIAYSKQVYNTGQWISWTEYLQVVNIATGEVQAIDQGLNPSWNPKP